MRFRKLHGLGNDFILVEQPVPADQIPLWCDRKLGIGADGILLMAPHAGGFSLRMWNPDGSESAMCGNGLRCAALAHFLDTGTATAVADFAGRDLRVSQTQTLVRAEMGPVNVLGKRKVQGHDGWVVDVGNPHFVIPVQAFPPDLATLGPALERDPAFPKGTNVHWALDHGDRMDLKTWERGAGLTLACGSGACAAVAALRGLGEAEVHLPGGPLRVEITPETAWQTGPAVLVFEGER